MPNNMYTQITTPLDQFEIRNLLSLDAPILGNLHISLTNIGLYLTIGTIFILGLNLLATNYNKVISNS
jgi:F-type H+-transporting ATPase subunit a